VKKTQIQNFVRKVYGKDIYISYYYNKSKESWMAMVKYVYPRIFGFKNSIVAICINKYWFNQYKKRPVVIRACLLHEVGHIATNTDGFQIRSSVRREYEAQIWAVKRAKQLGMISVAKYLENEWDWWLEEDWQSKFRRYRMAAMLRKKEK
jgi:hypothetical protein